MKKILLAGLLGAIVAFVWGFISWVVLPWHNMVMNKIKNEDAVVEVLEANFDRTGVYVFPGYEESQPMDSPVNQAVAEKFRRGPVGTIMYKIEGRDAMDPRQFVFGFFIYFIGASFLAMLLSLATDKLVKYCHRVIFVGMIGLFASVVSHLSDWNWLWYPTRFSLVNSADLTLTWIFAGLVIAWIIKPEK